MLPFPLFHLPECNAGAHTRTGLQVLLVGLVGVLLQISHCIGLQELTVG